MTDHQIIMRRLGIMQQQMTMIQDMLMSLMQCIWASDSPELTAATAKLKAHTESLATALDAASEPASPTK